MRLGSTLYWTACVWTQTSAAGALRARRDWNDVPQGLKAGEILVAIFPGALKRAFPRINAGAPTWAPDTNPLNPPPWTMRTAANGLGPSGMDASSGRGPLAWTAPLIYFIEKHPTPSAAASAVF